MVSERLLKAAFLCAAMMPSAALGGAPTPCRLCDAPVATSRPPSATPDVPLRIDVETTLDFSRVAQNGNQGGEVVVDPSNGVRRVTGGLMDLGGMTLNGTVRVSGTPNASIRVDLPTRVQLHSSSGGTADVIDIKTDLSPAPRLDGSGQLLFSFGGRLVVKGAVSGSFRGSIPITADYQ
jgi:Domain of unknown function (DUF4402)